MCSSATRLRHVSRGDREIIAPEKYRMDEIASRRVNDRTRPLVLIVEDQSDLRQLCAQELTISGFDVIEAANGLDAIAHCSSQYPDVILMDLSLPVMDGWEATRRLKADERTAHIPVVAVTGHALAGISEGAKQAGCDAFVTKPCLPEDLVKEIRKVLGRAPTDNPAKARRSAKY